MLRLLLAVLATAVLPVAAHAHFVFVVPEPGGGVAYVFLSEDLDPDDEVGPGMLSGLELQVRDRAGVDAPLDKTMEEHAFRVDYDAESARLIHGALQLGLHQPGDAPANLISYHPKAILGDAFDPALRLGDEHPVELVPVGRVGELRFRLLSYGRPVEGAEVTVLLPDGGGREVVTDAEGLTESFPQTGRFGAWSRATVGGPGTHEGVDYAEARAYATLVAQVGEDRRPTARVAAPTARAFPRLPQPTSSFGAVGSDGWLYVYGGHIANTHDYDTEAVSGRFSRLRIDGPPVWESLPPGPRLQGMNLAAHDGKVYRVGGMQPRNPRGTKADNHSVADCARFDPASMQWEWLPPLPEGRSSHDVVVLDDTLYVVGGWNMLGRERGNEWPEDMLSLDLTDPRAAWKRIPQPFARRALIVAAHEGRLHVMGGMDDEDEVSRRVDIFDPATQEWSRGPELLGDHVVAGFASAACVLDGRLYASVAGGEVQRLTDDGSAWELVGSHTPRIVHRLVPWQGRILVTGGADGGANSDLVEVLAPGDMHVGGRSEGRSTGRPTGAHRPSDGGVRRVADVRVPDIVADVASERVAAADGRQVFCPVMTNTEVLGDDEAIAVEYQGREVLLCCSKCARKWEADREAYLSAAVLPQLADLELPERTLEQVYCPVYPTRVVSENDPFVMYRGRKIYLFNKTAVRRFEEDPERYVDLTILPQLAE